MRRANCARPPSRALALACLTLLAAGCARYERQPLIAEEFRSALEGRSLEAFALAQPDRDASADSPVALSASEAEIVALHLNPRLRSAREAAGVARVSADHAGYWDDPEFGVDALRVLESVDEPWIAGASLSFTIPISGRLAVAKDAAEAEARVALLEAWSEEQAVLRELREALADFEAARRSRVIVAEQLERLGALVALTNRREELGEMIAVEAVAFRLAEARLRLDLGGHESEEEQARSRALELLGLLPDAKVAFAFPEGGAELATPFDEEDMAARCPAVLVAAARYEVAEERLRLEVRKQYPDIAIGPLYENEEGTSRLGVGLSLPIPILNGNRPGIAEAEAARQAARADWERAMQESLSALRRGESVLAAAEARLETLRSVVAPLANKQIEQARRLADQGEVNTLLILEALQSEREAALDLANAAASVSRAQAALRATMPEEVLTIREAKEQGD